MCKLEESKSGFFTLERMIKHNSSIRFVNCSKGALIKGCINEALNEYIKKLN